MPGKSVWAVGPTSDALSWQGEMWFQAGAMSPNSAGICSCRWNELNARVLEQLRVQRGGMWLFWPYGHNSIISIILPTQYFLKAGFFCFFFCIRVSKFIKEISSKQKCLFQESALVSMGKNNKMWVLVSTATKSTEDFIYSFVKLTQIFFFDVIPSICSPNFKK